MYLKDYYLDEQGTLRITRDQASDFAKRVAGDFNPIHDADAKRFCVPGDLLFSLILNKYGLSQHMNFQFAGMVGDGVPLLFPKPVSGSEPISITDGNGKTYLTIERSGAISNDPELIQSLTRRYVEFSGQTFPHILVPLMARHEVMPNPERPLVVYESMAIDMDRLDVRNPQLELSDSTLRVEGKRGNVCLEFNIKSAGEIVGKGRKTLVISGLRPFEEQDIQLLVNNYSERKQDYMSLA
jgi:hypothetical protein